MKIFAAFRYSYEKNWPEVHAVLTGALSQFIYARHPGDLRSCVPVFCYHPCDAHEFEGDLEFLMRNDYVTLDAQSLVDHLPGNKPASARFVVLSADAGARNLFDTGFPLLKRFTMIAVSFIVPRFHVEEFTTQNVNGGQRPSTWPEIRTMHDSGLTDFQSPTYEHRCASRWPEPNDMTGRTRN